MKEIEGLVREIERGPHGPKVGAFFDFDGTLIAGYSAAVFFREQLRRGQVTADEIARAVLAGLEMRLTGADVTRLMQIAAMSWAGRAEEELEQLSGRLFVQQVAGMVYPEARELVRAHQRLGHTVVIATSATRYQAGPLAESLGIEHVLHSRAEVEEGLLSGRLGGPVLWGENKAKAVRDFARSHRIALRQSHAYANGDEDVPFLSAVGHPHPLNPEAALERHAADKGWTSYRFTSRGTPGLQQVARTVAAIGSLPLAGLVGAGIGLLNRSRREAGNVATVLGSELALGLAGVEVDVVRGGEHLWSHRPAVFVFNHQSSLDMFILGHLIRQDLGGVAKKELARDPLFGPMGLLVPIAYVDRSNSASAREALRPVVDMLKQGISFAIAPEGTRSPTPNLQPFKKGAFHIAMQAGVPLVPIVIRNAGDLMWRGSFFTRSGTVEVAVLPPVETKGWKADAIDRHVEEMERAYRDTLDDWPGRDNSRAKPEAPRKKASPRPRRQRTASRRRASTNGQGAEVSVASTTPVG